jgi:hypothetical protein
MKLWLFLFKIVEITFLNNKKIQKMNGKMYKQILNVTSLKIYEKFGKILKRDIFKDNFD